MCSSSRNYLLLISAEYLTGVHSMEEPRPRNWPEWVPRSIDYPKVPLFSLLDMIAWKYPDTTAIIFQGTKITYRELKESVDRFTSALQNMGVTKGDRVALFLPNIPQFIISYYGALKAGAIVTAISPLYKEREVKPQLKDSGS